MYMPGRPSVRGLLHDFVKDVAASGREFFGNIYWPNRREYSLYFLVNFYYMEKITVLPALNQMRLGVEPPFPLTRGFSLEVGNVIRMKGGRVTDYEATLKGKDGRDVMVWRRSNSKVHFEFVDRAALIRIEEGDSEGKIVIRFGTI